MLTLMVLSVASMNAQVRIGGTDDPAAGVVLDLNATDTTVYGKASFVMPRVMGLNEIENPQLGMMAYLVTHTMIYYYDGVDWSGMSRSTYDNHSLYFEQGTVTIPANQNRGAAVIRAPYQYRTVCSLKGGYEEPGATCKVGWNSTLNSGAIHVVLANVASSERTIGFTCLTLD
ncbi:hypothetical protein FACS189428_7520 [Clostridia bacterium]|nr:hypothetical protein FACS189428_7520 [Clostridia bacterium]